MQAAEPIQDFSLTGGLSAGMISTASCWVLLHDDSTVLCDHKHQFRIQQQMERNKLAQRSLQRNNGTPTTVHDGLHLLCILLGSHYRLDSDVLFDIAVVSLAFCHVLQLRGGLAAAGQVRDSNPSLCRYLLGGPTMMPMIR